MSADEWLCIQEEGAPIIVPLELPSGDDPALVDALAREGARFFDALLRAGDPFNREGFCTLVIEEPPEPALVTRRLVDILAGLTFRASARTIMSCGGSSVTRPGVRVYRPLRGIAR
jgi:hypothetical protein